MLRIKNKVALVHRRHCPVHCPGWAIWRVQHQPIALKPQVVQMAFAPRGSKGPNRSPKHSPYRTASAYSHTPSSRAKTSLSFDRVQIPSGKACDDACSVRSSCGSDSRNTFKPSSTSWYVRTHTTHFVCLSLNLQGTEIKLYLQER